MKKWKAQSMGNTFILVDARSEDIPEVFSEDGLIVFRDSAKADFSMQIFNRDGSEAGMCGNGLRCLVKGLHRLHGLDQVTVETASGIRTGKVEGEKVSVDFGKPSIVAIDTDLGFGVKGHIIHTGALHILLLNEEEYLQYSYQLRERHDSNVSLARLDGDTIFLRTLERGVEKETGGCGTGGAAACALFWELGKARVKRVIFPSNEVSEARAMTEKGSIQNIFLSGLVIEDLEAFC